MDNFNMELDPIGQYYASVITPKHPGQFMLSAYLNEVVDPNILQQSVNEVVCRLPFLSGRLKPKFFSYHHELLSSPPQVVWMITPLPITITKVRNTFCGYFTGSVILR